MHGNVELNLSWPPATSSIDSEDEDDDEVAGDVAPTSLSTIDEGGEEEPDSKTTADQLQWSEAPEKEEQENEVKSGSGDSSTSSSIELSRSLQSDDSGLLFERYLR